MLWHHNARVNSHQRWKQTRFRACFHLWRELTSTMNVTEWQLSWNSLYMSLHTKWLSLKSPQTKATHRNPCIHSWKLQDMYNRSMIHSTQDHFISLPFIPGPHSLFLWTLIANAHLCEKSPAVFMACIVSSCFDSCHFWSHHLQVYGYKVWGNWHLSYMIHWLVKRHTFSEQNCQQGD